MKIIEAKNIKKSFNKNTMALRGADFAIEEGEIVAVVGASGSGKSTLLHCLAGILKIDSGEVLFEGKNIGKITVIAPKRMDYKKVVLTMKELLKKIEEEGGKV